MMMLRNPNGSTRVEFLSNSNNGRANMDGVKLDTKEKALDFINSILGEEAEGEE